MRSSRSIERTIARALRWASSTWRMLQAQRTRTPPPITRATPSRPAGDEIGDLFVQVRAVRRAVPAEEDADEAEDHGRHADRLEPRAHVAPAASTAGPVDDGGQPLQARRHGASPDRRARGAADGGTAALANPGVTGRTSPGSGLDPPKSFIADSSEVGQVVGGGGEALHQRVAVHARGAEELAGVVGAFVGVGQGAGRQEPEQDESRADPLEGGDRQRGRGRGTRSAAPAPEAARRRAARPGGREPSSRPGAAACEGPAARVAGDGGLAATAGVGDAAGEAPRRAAAVAGHEAGEAVEPTCTVARSRVRLLVVGQRHGELRR